MLMSVDLINPCESLPMGPSNSQHGDCHLLTRIRTDMIPIRNEEEKISLAAGTRRKLLFAAVVKWQAKNVNKCTASVQSTEDCGCFWRWRKGEAVPDGKGSWRYFIHLRINSVVVSKENLTCKFSKDYYAYKNWLFICFSKVRKKRKKNIHHFHRSVIIF